MLVNKKSTTEKLCPELAFSKVCGQLFLSVYDVWK